jgi:hypothetical protein
VWRNAKIGKVIGGKPVRKSEEAKDGQKKPNTHGMVLSVAVPEVPKTG